jgi:hypothetical protein
MEVCTLFEILFGRTLLENSVLKDNHQMFGQTTGLVQLFWWHYFNLGFQSLEIS